MRSKGVTGGPRHVDETGRVNRLYSVLSSVNEAIVRVREPQALYDAACQIAVEQGHFIFAWIGFAEKGSHFISPVAKYGRDEGYLETLRLSLDDGVPEGRGPTGSALREGRSFVNNDTANNPVMAPWREAQLARGYRSTASFPLRSDGATVGAITLYAGEPDYFDDEEIRLLECLADDFSFALEAAEVAAQRKKAAAELQASREQLEVRVREVSADYEDLIEQRTEQAVYAEALNRINDGVHSTLDFDEIMNRALIVIVDALNVDAAVVQVRLEDHWEFVYSHGLPEELRSAHLSDDDVPLSMEVSRSREPIFVSDVATDDRVNVRTMQKFGITALMAVPLIVRGDVFGVLVVDRFGVPAPFSEQQHDFLQKAAAVLALGLENARLFEAEATAKEIASRELARTRLLQDVAVAASKGSSVLEVCDRALRAAGGHWDLSMGAVYSYNSALTSLELVASLGIPDDLKDTVVRLDMRSDTATLATRAAMERRAVATEDVPISGPRKRLLERSGVSGLQAIAVPLEASGMLLGTLSLTFTKPGLFSEEERDLVQAIAGIIGQAFENARLLEAERQARLQARRELATTRLLQGIAEAATTSMSVEEVAERALEAAATRAITVKSGAIYAFDRQEGLLTRLASRGLDDECDYCADLSVADDRRALVVQAVSSGDVVTASGAGSTTRLAVPILHQGATVGAALFVFEREQAIRPDEIGLYRSLARILGQAFENMRLHESTQEVARLGDALNDVNASVHSTLELDHVMQHALQAGVDALGCDAGAIEIPEGDEWVVRYQTGFSASDIGMRLGKDQAPIAARAASESSILAVTDLSGDEWLDVGFVKRYRLRSVLAVPFVARGEVIGCALFYTKASPRRFTDAEIDFGQKLASAVSLGLENARLYGVEHRIAETLQQALLSLPEELPGVEFAPFYQSATEFTLVGGDFYDIFEIDERSVGITIGDIAGKGLSAAVLTSLVRNTIRAYAFEDGRHPAEILAVTNEIVVRSTPNELFATVFFAVLDRLDGRLVYASAGHTTSAIVRQDDTVSQLPSTGPVLGAFYNMQFDQREAVLAPGEILFLYTDGLTEARSDNGLYGEERLFADLVCAKARSTRDAAEQAVARVMRFADNYLRDDLAILAIRRPKHATRSRSRRKAEA
jgi:GAF domain-containing protein